MTASPFDDLRVLFTKQGTLSDRPAWFIINRSISMSGKHLGIATNMNHVIFKLQDKPELLKLIYNCIIPKQKMPWMNYIKKSKEEEGEYDFLLDSIQVYFHWTDREAKEMKPLLLQLLKNENKLRKMMSFIGAEKKQYDVLGMKFDFAETGLGKFMVK
jgi:hypothetical protein